MAAKVKRDGDFWYDESAADQAVAFFPTYLVFTTGEWAGRPFHLEPWEADDIVRPLFGWKRKDGTRRYRRCFVWVPRKNGKTELAAGIALLLLVGDGEQGGQVLSIATDKDQASLVFDKSLQMLQQSPGLQEAPLVPFTSSIFAPNLNAVYKPLAGVPKGKHGLNMSGMVGDEVHEWANDKLYNVVHKSSAARRQPVEFLISTAGEKTGHGWDAYQECLAILAGEMDDPETLVVMYGADAKRDEDDPTYWQDPETWKAANPNYGVSVKPEFMIAECRKASQLPRLENDFKRYHLNLWVEQSTRWLPMVEWERCGWAPIEAVPAPVEMRPGGPMVIPQRVNDRWKSFPALCAGRRCFGGVDLSSTTDLTCLLWLFEPLKEGGKTMVIPRFYCPEVGIELRSKRDKVKYDEWVRVGALTATKGNAVDYNHLKMDLFSDAERFKVAQVAVDRYNATQMTVELRDEGIDAKLFGQGFVSMSAPAKELEKMLLAGRLDHGGHPVLTWNARNVAVETDAPGNIKPSKAKSTERIDGIVALVMALGASMEAEKPVDLDEALNNPVMA